MINHFKIAIIGRTNVGKTTFFNKFCKKQLGIVSDFSGLTRDINSFQLEIDSCSFEIFDTPGFEKDSIFFQKIQKPYFNLIEKADLVMFFADGKSGFLDEDRVNLGKIKKFLSKTILVINKCENENKINKTHFLNLPFEQMFYISAEHSNGIKNLLTHLVNLYLQKGFEVNFNTNTQSTRLKNKAIVREIEGKEQQKKISIETHTAKNSIPLEDSEGAIKISVIGRPNAGKSTFLNNILKEERLCVSSIAGTTRDAIRVPFNYETNGKVAKFEFIDTAGIRRKSKVIDNIEKMSIDESLKNLDLANVIFFIADAENALDFQDLKLINLIIKEGRILIFLINKWDKVIRGTENNLVKTFKEHIVDKVSQIKGLSFFTISAIKDTNFNAILDEAIRLHAIWTSKISSKDLNNWLRNINFSPFIGNRKLKLKFIRQTNIKPPKFLIFCNFEEKDIATNHINYIRNELIKAFNLYGVTIRLEFKKEENNPFADKKDIKRTVVNKNQNRAHKPRGVKMNSNK